MEVLHNLAFGFEHALTIHNLMYCALGCMVGTLVGLLPGLGPLATIHYYRELAKAQAGEMLIVHADMEYGLRHVRSGDLAGLAAYFAGLIANRLWA